MRQGNALLTSTSLAWFMSLLVWQILCSLQKMDQKVIQQQNVMALLRAIKLHDTIGLLLFNH